MTTATNRPAPTHGIACGSNYQDFDHKSGEFIDTGFPMLHDWGTELEMLDKLTDPDLPRQYCRNLGVPGGKGKEYGYFIVEITQGDVDYELARREQDIRDQDAHPWAM